MGSWERGGHSSNGGVREKEAISRCSPDRQRKREGLKAGRREGQGVWTLGWPTFPVTLAKTSMETLSMWGEGPEEP